KSALEQIRELEIKAERDARQKFQHRHFATEAVPNRAQFEPNRTCTDHEKFLWRLLEAKRFGTADDGFAIEFCERQLDSHASSRNHDIFCLDFLRLAAA